MSEKKLETVKALLAKANSTDSVEEAEALNAKILELMFKYGFDESQLKSEERKQDRFEKRFYFFGGALSKTHLTGAYRVGNASFGNTLRFLYFAEKTYDWRKVSSSRDKRKGLYLEAFGFTQELDQFELLYPTTVIQATRMMARFLRKDGEDAIVEEMKYSGIQYQSAKLKVQRSYLLGFYSGLARKLTETRRVIVDETPEEYALALIDKAKVIDQQPEFANVRKGRVSNVGSGYSAGVKAGYAHNTSSSVGGGRTAIGR